MEFQSKVAIITGAAQGVGRATALALAREGAAVVVVDADAASVQAVAEGVTSWGGRALALAADVANEADAARVAAETVATFGGIDLLINSATLQIAGSVESTPLDLWNRMISVNLTGVYLMARAVLPELRRHGGGVIINVAALHALRGETGWAAYTASQGGVVALSREMALDYASEGIRVNCVCPGMIDTPMLRAAARHERRANPDELLQTWAARQPLGRLGSPEEIADLILFLASPRASFITGSVYTADGGLSAGF
ncbi:short-chain dehydrogenase/reductase SDR [Oscillochloris trichoides DG-6]|uniref:Short-chain dehydrogenase/reductase SDR n=1 Tax=Oscillochloris trichoides DG-6 TaxID=765420 RepID=E1IIL6_9CHLR|nr:glucose 1-dehydrogenase [Oscillochloris trichoides]EFO78966.1 short-chain dehydrogenase/reductase SDR [Oscillochloris trichoides DG-6]